MIKNTSSLFYDKSSNMCTIFKVEIVKKDKNKKGSHPFFLALNTCPRKY
jgi:hypothetical protein